MSVGSFWKYLKNGEAVYMILAKLGFKKNDSDENYLKHVYKAKFGKKLNLDSPVTYNEKLQWLKLYDRELIYSKMVDKYEVKEFVEKTVGREYVIKTLGIWDNFDDINFDDMPNQFVLKCTHDSGGIVICRDKSSFNIKAAKRVINKSLAVNYYYHSREWPYKEVKPRIIAEEFVEDSTTNELRDYKFFCFNGKVRAMFIATDRKYKNKETKFDFYDMDFKHLPFTNGHPNADLPPEKPSNFEKMVYLAERLSANIPHVRCDFYEVNGKVYFGELTFYHWGGFVPFVPEKWDYIFGSWLQLPEKKISKTEGIKWFISY